MPRLEENAASGLPNPTPFFLSKEGGGRFIHAQDQQERSHKLMTACRSAERAFSSK